MILDSFLQFDPTGTSLAIAAGTQASTNIIDLHGANLLPVLANLQGARDMGIGSPLRMLVQVSTTFTSAGAGTLQVALQGATDNGSGAPSTWVSWWLSPLYALATLNAGSRLYDMDFPRPPDGVAIPRFVRILYTVATATMTAGAVGAWIVLNRFDQPYMSTDNSIVGGYPAGINVAN